MTDIPSEITSVVARLGVAARFDGELFMELSPRPETCRHGIVRLSVLAFAVDAVSGVAVDTDPDMWTLTSDMSLRMRPVPAPALVRATNTVLRQGRRSVTCQVECRDDVGVPVATAAIGFARVARRADDPPKPGIGAKEFAGMFHGQWTLDRPVREAAGIEVLDAAAGRVAVEVTRTVRNPAGTLQGAMVALLAEVAIEELVGARLGSPAVVTELDLRYIAQARQGQVTTEARLLGDGPDAPVEVQLVDERGRVTTHAYGRATTVPRGPR